MISENLAQLFSNLSRDNVSYFSENWSTIIKNKDIKENFLSYCLEEKAFNVFEFAVNKGLNELRILVLANAIRNNNQKIVSLIIDNKLFQYQDKKASDLLSISVNNNDVKVVEYLLDKVTISEDILMFSLAGHSKEFIVKFTEMGFIWNYMDSEQNPIVYIMENYKNDKAEFIDLILKISSQAEKIKHDAIFYFEDTQTAPLLEKILNK